MKADELKIYCVRTDYLGITDIKNFAVNVVLKSDVDEAIDELKADNKLLKERIANGDVSRITWIDNALDLIKENEELKQKLHDAEMAKDLAEAAETERKIDYENLKKDLAYHARQTYFKHNRQTLRALWLAQAERAFSESEKYLCVSEYETSEKWKKVEHLCRAKADTFKENK